MSRSFEMVRKAAQRQHDSMEDPFLAMQDFSDDEPEALKEIRSANEHAQNLINHREVNKPNQRT